MTPHDEQKLERLITTVVRGLPDQRAPLTLEARVQAELARRAALPWWRKSFAHWPLAARAILVVVCAAMIEGVVALTEWASAGVPEHQVKAAFAPGVAWLQAAETLITALREAITLVVAHIPPVWLYSGAAIIAAVYLTLLGAGAVAYRTLHSSS